MKFRNILGMAAVAATAALTLTSPAGATSPDPVDSSPAVVESASTPASEPASEPASTPASTPPSSPTANPSSPSPSQSCDAACLARCELNAACKQLLAQCGMDAACRSRIVVQVQVNVVVGAPCPMAGQRGVTAKKEECACKQPGNAPAEQPRWVLAGNSSPKAQSLPVTGASTMWIAVAGGLVLLLGTGVFVMARRRRVRFSA